MIAAHFDRASQRPARAARLDALGPARHESFSAECKRLRQRVQSAEARLESNPDAAALLLDGLLSASAVLASRLFERPPDGSGDMLAAVEASAPLLALRLRLALGAPDVRSRIVHVRACLDCIERVLDAAGSRDADPSAPC